ncbi:MAG: histidine kinase dimerization/phosphoacceptor domain -containing protein [Nitrospirota bacterium]
MSDTKARVFLIEDDKVDQMAFKRLVKESDLPYDYSIAGSVSEAKEMLGLNKFEVVISDYLLGDGTALDIFDSIVDIPIIVVTGSGDEEIAVKAMKAGAYDYLIKDPKGNYLKVLPVTVENALGRKKNEELVKKHTAELVKTNKQLQMEIIERKKMEERIKASLKEKEILLKEIHHRVRNNMQVIYGLFEIQSDYIRDKQCLDIIKGCQNQLLSIGLVHKILYKSDDLANIDFHGYIKSLAGKIFDSYGISTERVELKIDIDDISIGIDASIRCGLIISELVSNSLKYAFPDEKKGEIKIGLHTLRGKEVELVVSDNGIGIPEDLDIKKTDTLGLKMVEIFVVDMLRGSIEVSRAAGTKYIIKFRTDKSPRHINI